MVDGLGVGRAFAVPSASGADDSTVQFGVLGPVRIRVAGVSLPLGTPKQRVVLAVLIVNANRPVAIDTLIGAAWDQRPPAGARATLHAYISNLRRLMSNAGIDRSALASAPPGYQLSLPVEHYDFGRFTAEKSAGVQEAAGGRFEQASSHLATALAQWRGPVLEDLRDFHFVDTLSVALEEEKVLTHIAHAEAEIACGRPQAVIGELEALTADHGYREPLWAQLITAYYLADRQSDALEAYQRLKTLLADDLGIDPGVTIRELHQRILRQEDLDVCTVARSHAEDTLVAQSNSAIRVRSAATAGLRGADGQRHPLTRTATRIGRSPDNDIVLTDAKVSRHHTVITDDGSTVTITDLGSANGVRVHGRRIDTSAVLRDGDRIGIGDQEFTLEAEAPHAT